MALNLSSIVESPVVGKSPGMPIWLAILITSPGELRGPSGVVLNNHMKSGYLSWPGGFYNLCAVSYW
jgi:hypothetical protein